MAPERACTFGCDRQGIDMAKSGLSVLGEAGRKNAMSPKVNMIEKARSSRAHACAECSRPIV